MPKIVVGVVGIIMVIIIIGLYGGMKSRGLSALKKTSATDIIDTKSHSLSLGKNPDKAKGQSEPPATELNIHLNQILQGNASSKEDTVLNTPATERKDSIWLPVAVIAINIAIAALIILRTKR